MLKTTVEHYHINFSNSDFSVDITLSVSNFLGMFFIVLPREACLKMLI